MYNFLTLGYDCSPAAALRSLNLREFALPFDWVISNIRILELCFKDNFENFHKQLYFNHNKTRMIDYYGFEFPHDYPLTDISNNEFVGEGIFGEENGKCITDNWKNYYNIVKSKYDRRIERFLNIMNDDKPIIILSRYNANEVIKLQSLLKKYYNKTNIIFINSSTQSFEIKNIINIYTEKNGIWNDSIIWTETINKVIQSKIFLE
jgi:hypothetical protein